MSEVCVSCRHNIDPAAKLCPYCGADPNTGYKIDTQTMLQEIFRPREMSAGESVMEYARQRQGTVVAASVIAAFLLLAGLHWFVSSRNRRDVTDSPAVSLTEIADLSNQQQESRPQQMPNLNFLHSGRPQTLRTFVVEPGATTPPEVIAAQQAAQAAQQAAAVPPGAGAARPGVPPAAGAARPGVPQPGLPQPGGVVTRPPIGPGPVRPAVPQQQPGAAPRPVAQ